MRYVVLTVNQASGWPDDSSLWLHRTHADALDDARERANKTARVGRRERHYIAKLEDSVDWEEVAPENGRGDV